MSSSHWEHPVARPTMPRESSHHHSLSANMAVSYLNRNIPSYYMTDENQMEPSNNSRSDSLFAPRYSPNPRPWRRQHSHSGLSFVPSPRPEQSEYTISQQPKRPADRSPACISPFRSVRRMKQPFQLMLPASPSCDHTSKEPRASRQASGSHASRTWRSDQNPINASLETFGLLPSPPLSDSRASHPPSSSAYFSPKPDSEYEKDRESTDTCDCVPGAKACDGCEVPKSEEQPEERNGKSEITTVHMAHSTLVKQYDAKDHGSTPPPVDMDVTASSPNSEAAGQKDESGSIAGMQRSRAATASSQASWAPDNFSYCQNWLQGVETMDSRDEKSKEANRRKCQIVQVQGKIASTNSSPANHDVKDVKLAVASKTKPKLVDISRQSSPSMGCSAPNTQHMVPSTPDHRQQEISAFSPETPLDIDSGYVTQQSCFSPADSRDDKDDSTDATSLSSESISSTIVCDKPSLSPDSERPTPPPKVGIPAADISMPDPDTSPGTSSDLPEKSEKSEKEQLEKWWDHEWSMDQLALSVEEFPQSKLKLTSPVIMFLRVNDEKSLIRPFRKIFPDAAETDLDCLCATLIARNYIVDLSARNSGYPHKRTLSRLDTAPGSCSTLGIRFAQALPSQIKDRLLGSRSVEIRKGLDQIVEKLLDTICGRPDDEILKSAVVVLAEVLEKKP